MVKASADFDVNELLSIFGPEGKDVVASSDTVQDKEHAQEFAKEAAEKKSIEISKSNPNRATLTNCRRRGLAFPRSSHES